MSVTELNERFGRPNQPLPEDVAGELESIMRLHSLSEQELFFKWEAYSIKMGAENTATDYKTVRDFKKDLQDALDRESRGKAHLSSANKRAMTSNARTSNTGDVYDVLDGMVGGTPNGARSAVKRRNNFETPASKHSKAHMRSSPTEQKTQTPETTITSFADRPNAGQILETLNAHIPSPMASSDRPSEARVKLKANTELAKFNYKPMAMKLSEASEILDDRIDEFAALIQEHHGFPDAAFGNPAAQSSSEIIAVGRIASDSEGKVNAASLVLETSRRMGAGMRIPLRMESAAFDFFPGKIVALRGTNPSGESFIVSEMIPVPFLPLPASSPDELDVHNARLSGSDPSSNSARPLNLMVCSGPYTPDTDLSFSALHAALDTASTNAVDVLVLNGPFLDLDHPLIASGDFSLPDTYPVSPDHATLLDAFKAFISAPLSNLASRHPSITIILVPSTRDAISKHVSWPQDRLPKRELGLPKQVTCVTNPITLSINELVVGISSQDVLMEMQRQSVSQGTKGVSDDVLARLSRGLVEQRHFFPVWPPLSAQQLPKPASLGVVNGSATDRAGEDIDERLATPACLDLPYLKLGEWIGVRPDLLITPSALTPFAKVVESVVVVNPGTLSKRRGPGTFAQLSIVPRQVTDGEKGERAVGHELYNRARVDVIRI